MGVNPTMSIITSDIVKIENRDQPEQAKLVYPYTQRLIYLILPVEHDLSHF